MDKAGGVMVVDDSESIRIAYWELGKRATNSIELEPKQAVQIAEQLLHAAARHMET